jgi:hypothetical protein
MATAYSNLEIKTQLNTASKISVLRTTDQNRRYRFGTKQHRVFKMKFNIERNESLRSKGKLTDPKHVLCP